MLLSLIRESAPLRRLVVRAGESWIERKVREIADFSFPGANMLDVGSGNCLAAAALRRNGYRVECVDIEDLSVVPAIRPVVYDGRHLPFQDRQFDIALLVSVLHHTLDPVRVLSEAARVAHRILILEDTYLNPAQQYLTYAADTVVNMGHSRMTYQNRDEAGWESLFSDLGLKISEKRSRPALGLFRQTWFVLEHDR